MSSKVRGFRKGMLVRRRVEWGSMMGQVNKDHLYLIRAIGPKEMTYSHVNEETMKADKYGRRDYLYSKEFSEDRRISGDDRLHPYEWSQILVPFGEGGWDPAENII